MAVVQLSSQTVQPRASRKNTIIFDETVKSLADAARKDFRQACKNFSGIPEALADVLGIKPLSSYTNQRDTYQWTPERLEAVVQVTGGANVLAYLARLAARAQVLSDDHHAVAADAARVVQDAAAVNAQVAEDLAPDDDTPNRIDGDERLRLLQMLENTAADIALTMAQVRALKSKG